MKFITQGKTNLKYILIVVILAVIVGGGILAWQYWCPVEKPLTPLEISPTDETADWKSYRNDEFEFELKYPPELTLSSTGPNVAQQAIERGEQISGTIRPSFDAIIFSDQNNEKKFQIEIFYPKEGVLSESGYIKDYPYLYGPCDLRWGFEPTTTRMMNINNIEVLEVKGKISSPLDEPLGFQSCYYFKNYNKNLIVLSTEKFEEQQNFEEIDSMLRSILSTLILFETGETANWKTYRNSKYQIKYPQDWHIFDYSFSGLPLYPPSNPPNGSLEIFLTEKGHFPAYNETDKIGSFAIKLRSDITAKGLANSRRIVDCVVENITVDGQEGFKATCIQQIDWYFQDKTSSLTFQVGSSFPASAKETSPALFEKIFSTFKFIK